MMILATSSIWVLPILLFIVAYIVYFATYHWVFSPLARIPSAHRTSALTSLWILSKRYKGCIEEIAAVNAAHELHGPVVRLAPREISVRSWEVGLSHMLGARLEKPDWYSVFTNYRLVLQFKSSLLLC
jgi:hypothetical protein